MSWRLLFRFLILLSAGRVFLCWDDIAEAQSVAAIINPPVHVVEELQFQAGRCESWRCSKRDVIVPGSASITSP